jgi:hypothetical protein
VDGLNSLVDLNTSDEFTDDNISPFDFPTLAPEKTLTQAIL